MMRALKAVIVAAFLAVLAFPASGGMLINSYRFASASPASITFLQCAQDASNSSSYTFSSQNTGTASADRRTIVAVAIEDGVTNFTINSVTVGGDSATELYSTIAADIEEAAIFGLTNTSGTSEDIVVTLSEAVTSANICVYQVNNLTSLTPVDTSNDGTEELCGSSTGNAVCNLAVDVQSGGIAIGVSAHGAAGSSGISWTGLTEDSEAGASESSISVASYAVTSTETGRAITVTPTGGVNTVAIVSLR